MISKNIEIVRTRIAEACKRAGRNPGEISLIAVTKTIPAVRINEAVSLGILHIAESKVQEAQVKFTELGGATTAVTKHFIGHLQTNKAKKAVELFDVIQSLDSLRLAGEINKQAKMRGKIQDCLIEIKVSGEDTKSGIRPEDASAFIEQLSTLESLRIKGLMAMAPYFDSPELARPYFKKAKDIFDSLGALSNLATLSMGMSGDFETAIEEGATMVRIGAAIFGERQ